MRQRQQSIVAWRRRVNPHAPSKNNEAPPIAYFMNLFPNLTETFVYREVDAVRRLGRRVVTFSIRRPGGREVSPEARHHIDSTFYFLPVGCLELLMTHLAVAAAAPIRYVSTFAAVVGGTHVTLRDRLRTLCHFAEAVSVVPTIRALGVRHIHAHFAVGSATCAWVVARFLDISFSVTAHAYDIWQDRLLLPEKLDAADFTVTCTQYSQHYLQQLRPAAAPKIATIYHGVELKRFAPAERPDGAGLRILSVGRLVDQKGFATLLRACALLVAGGRDVRCEIVGDGPLRQALEADVAALGLHERVRFAGWVFQDAMPDLYRTADVFALACQRAPDGDMDGIPNVIWEAMASGVPVVSTRLSGIPEAVENGVCGLLVQPQDTEALAAALGRLHDDAVLRHRLGAAARQRVAGWASVDDSARRLLERIDALVAARAAQSQLNGLPHLMAGSDT